VFTAVVVVFIGGTLALGSRGSHVGRFCGGVGLMTDTYGSTPREAVAAYIRSRGGDPKYWRFRGSGAYATGPLSHPRGLASIGASEASPGVWRVDGGCVGNYAQPPVASSGTAPGDLSSSDCTKLALTITEGPTHAPFATWQFAVTNASSTSCMVWGHPSVRLSGNNYPFSFWFVRRSGVLVASASPEHVNLAAHRSAYFVLEKDACTSQNGPGVDKADVFFGNSSKPITASVPGHLALCGPSSYDDDPITETPVVRDLSQAYLATPAPQRCRARDLAASDAGLGRSAGGFRAWVIRLTNIGATPCDLRSDPHVFFYGSSTNLVGLKTAYARHDGTVIRGGAVTTVSLAPGASAFVGFEKGVCSQPEQPIGSAAMQLFDRGTLTIPVPAGLQKCDFKEPAGNTIRYGPAATDAASLFIGG